MHETSVQFLGQEDPLEKWMATHSSILAWRIPWTEEPGGLQSMGLQRVENNWATELNWKPLTAWITTNLKILQETGIPDYLTCLMRNLYAGQEATVRTGHRTTDGFQIVHLGCILSPWLFNLYAEYIMRDAWLDESTSWNQHCRKK